MEQRGDKPFEIKKEGGNNFHQGDGGNFDGHHFGNLDNPSDDFFMGATPSPSSSTTTGAEELLEVGEGELDWDRVGDAEGDPDSEGEAVGDALPGVSLASGVGEVGGDTTAEADVDAGAAGAEGVGRGEDEGVSGSGDSEASTVGGDDGPGLSLTLSL